LVNSFYLDASALVKRYVIEKGSPHVHAILDGVPHNRIHLLNIGAGEVVSILVRKRNAGNLSAASFGQAYVAFETEILRAAEVYKQSVSHRLVVSSVLLIVSHSINSTDALTLRSALAIARNLRSTGDDLVLVASDMRLLRAAQSEGLHTFDPEKQDRVALSAFLGP
jgi:predicted nucleic acid-binding protein